MRSLQTKGSVSLRISPASIDIEEGVPPLFFVKAVFHSNTPTESDSKSTHVGVSCRVSVLHLMRAVRLFDSGTPVSFQVSPTLSQLQLRGPRDGFDQVSCSLQLLEELPSHTHTYVDVVTEYPWKFAVSLQRSAFNLFLRTAQDFDAYTVQFVISILGSTSGDGWFEMHATGTIGSMQKRYYCSVKTDDSKVQVLSPVRDLFTSSPDSPVTGDVRLRLEYTTTKLYKFVSTISQHVSTLTLYFSTNPLFLCYSLPGGAGVTVAMTSTQADSDVF